MSSTPRLVHLALAQFESTLCEPVINTKKACSMIEQAAGEGSDMVVFPELFSTGYHLNTIGSHLMDLAEPANGSTVCALQKAAQAAHCYVVAGLALTHHLTGIPYNSSVIIDRDGSLLGTYDKQHLWSDEKAYFRPGQHTPVFDTDFGRVGIMICYDMGYPEVARMLTLQGADLIICLAAWCAEDVDVWEINVHARALENTVYLAAVNRFGREGDLFMPGRTLVCNPRGRAVARLQEEKEGILHATVNLQDIAEFRTRSPYLRDRRPELYKSLSDLAL